MVWLNQFMCTLHCDVCSLVEQKINRLREMAAENARMLRNREDTALQYKRCVLGWT